MHSGPERLADRSRIDNCAKLRSAVRIESNRKILDKYLHGPIAGASALQHQRLVLRVPGRDEIGSIC
jgi:hypothetical protein